ncbi:AAA family ATPase [Tateyamaria sp. Alg231-49]|uniref:AAA family ATPase n=1 Tax=Tateyamaria sp. Alg231-49 TaxID=1922219 RepID=UPI000D555837|nr:AAA family ATPase [Tateyamaria sp. Alg231-49]
MSQRRMPEGVPNLGMVPFDYIQEPGEQELIGTLKRQASKIIKGAKGSQKKITAELADLGASVERFNGHWRVTKGDLSINIEAKGMPTLPVFQPVGEFNFEEIPATDFLYRDFYARGYTSLTIAAPKVGKSMLALAEAQDMASGGKVFGVNVEPRRVLYLNAEDDQNVLHGRYAANCIRNEIDQSQFENRLFLQSGVKWPDLFLVGQKDRDIMINEVVFENIIEQIESLNIDVVVFDPLQDLSHADESNDAFRLLGQRIRRMASESNIAVHIVHHTRKVTAGMIPTIDDARGGSSLRGTSRFNRILVGMTEGQATDAGEDDPRFFFRVGDVESNLAPPSSERNQWFRKSGVILPNGQSVGALSKWEWPDAFEGITLQMAVDTVRELNAMQEGAARASSQATDWFGYVVARICNIDMPPESQRRERKAAKAKVKSILDQWVSQRWLQVAQIRDENQRKDRPTYAVGPVHPND